MDRTLKQRALLLTLWLVALAILGVWIQRTLTIGTDLRLFMPQASNAEERFLLQEIGESPGSRLLLLAVRGDEPTRLAQLSMELASALDEHNRQQPAAFTLVANGDTDRDSIPERLLPYRYLLTDAATRGAFDAKALRETLTERLRDLTSPAAGAIEQWVARDPTLETLQLAEAWLPAQEPQRLHGVWFDATGRTAMLVAETAAAAFDPPRQAAAIATLERTFEQIRGNSTASLTVSGPGAFAVLMQRRVSGEASSRGLLASMGIALLLLLAYRDWRVVLVGLLPLLSAALVGLATVTAAFGTVHGITLAFGFTLLGMAQDYPIHLFSHRRPGEAATATARRIWRPMITGVASTCIAYLAFLVAGVTGLAQLAWFTVAGLLTAGFTTRYLLPRLLPADAHDRSAQGGFARLAQWLHGLPRPVWPAVILVLVSVGAVATSRTPLWENDLSKLTPVPAELLREDTALRRELGAPDVRYLLVIHGSSAPAVLAATERQTAILESLLRDQVIAGFDNATRYLPSRAVQLARRDALPDAATLQAALANATGELPFARDAFQSFEADIAAARQLLPLTIADLAGTPLELRVGGMLFERESRWVGVTTFNQVRDPAALIGAFAGAGEDIAVIDMKRASETLVARQRGHIIKSLGIASLLLMLVIAFTLRSTSRAWRVLTPMLVTTLVTVAVLQVAGISLGLFHLVALALAAGLGLDYALFFEHTSTDASDQRRTLHAVLLCVASTWLVFVLLASSSVPVLRSIGVTVAVGVACNFLLALLISRRRGSPLNTTR